MCWVYWKSAHGTNLAYHFYFFIGVAMEGAEGLGMAVKWGLYLNGINS